MTLRAPQVQQHFENPREILANRVTDGLLYRLLAEGASSNGERSSNGIPNDMRSMHAGGGRSRQGTGTVTTSLVVPSRTPRYVVNTAWVSRDYVTLRAGTYQHHYSINSGPIKTIFGDNDSCSLNA